MPGALAAIAYDVDPTTLYYFLSTVAQALGAGFGILAAFAVFKLDALRRERREAGGIIKKRYNEEAEAKGIVDGLPTSTDAIVATALDDVVRAAEFIEKNVAAQNYRAVAEAVEKTWEELTEHTHAATVQGAADTIGKSYESSRQVERRLLRCSIVAAVTVGVSVVLLPLVPRLIAADACWRAVVYFGVCLLAFATLGTFVWFARGMAAEKEEDDSKFQTLNEIAQAPRPSSPEK